MRYTSCIARPNTSYISCMYIYVVYEALKLLGYEA